jgi:diguanylate cyclase (GGDEF)-like protein
MAITDELTQLFTRKHFNDLFQAELARSIRYGRTLCCAVIEIDGHGEIKEKYGSQIGDEIFQDTAESLKDDLRVVDVIARDDDRFICLFPESDIDPALFVSKRLRSVIEGETFETGGNDGLIGITISIGITESKPVSDGEVDIFKIIDVADKALTLAKQQGGNRIEFLSNSSAGAA